MTGRALRIVFGASFACGVTLGAAACNEKKTSETAASADVNAQADAGLAASGADAGDAGDAGPETNAADAGDAGSEVNAADAGGAGRSSDGGAARGADASAASALETAARGDGGSDGGGSHEGGGAKGPVAVDETAAGKTIDLAVGQKLTLSLRANATSGFDWSVTKAPAALGAPEMTYVQGGSQMGAAGTRKITWTLKTALPAGDHAVELAYARSFEKGVVPFKTFKLKVRAAH